MPWKPNAALLPKTQDRLLQPTQQPQQPQQLQQPLWSEQDLERIHGQKPALGKTDLGAEAPGTFDVFTEAAKRGLKSGLTSAKQGLLDPFADVKPEQQPQDYTAQLLNQGVSEGYSNPDWWVAHLTRGLTESSPTLGTGVVGALGGSAVGGPFGAVVGGSGGLALGSIVQTIAPAYQAARAEGYDHETAVDRAMQQSRIAGWWSAAMGAAPGVPVFGKTAEGALKRPISEALAQIFGVQPALVAGRTVDESLQMRGELPSADQVGTAMAEAAGVGALLTGAHAGGRTIYNRATAPREAPTEVLPPYPAPEKPLSFIDLIPDAEGVYGGTAGAQRAITQPRPLLEAPKGGPEGVPPPSAPEAPRTPPQRPSGGQDTFNARQEFAQRLRELADTTPGPVRTSPEATPTTTVPWSREVGARPSTGVETAPKPQSRVDYAFKGPSLTRRNFLKGLAATVASSSAPLPKKIPTTGNIVSNSGKSLASIISNQISNLEKINPDLANRFGNTVLLNLESLDIDEFDENLSDDSEDMIGLVNQDPEKFLDILYDQINELKQTGTLYDVYGNETPISNKEIKQLENVINIVSQQYGHNTKTQQLPYEEDQTYNVPGGSSPSKKELNKLITEYDIPLKNKSLKELFTKKYIQDEPTLQFLIEDLIKAGHTHIVKDNEVIPLPTNVVENQYSETGKQLFNNWVNNYVKELSDFQSFYDEIINSSNKPLSDSEYYHGGTYKEGPIEGVLYLTKDPDFARSYVEMAQDRGMEDSALQRVDVPLQRKAPMELVERLADQNGVEIEGSTPAGWFDKNIQPPGSVERLVAALQNQGFDHAELKDIPYGTGAEAQDVTVAFPKKDQQRIDKAIEVKPLSDFYSPAQQTLSNITQKRAPASQWVGMLEKKNPAAGREARQLGLDIWLEEQGKGKAVSKEEINNWLKANEITVEQKTFTEPDLKQGYSRVEPYGENYGETVIKVSNENFPHFDTPHFGENEIAVISHSDRIGPNGEKLFSIEQVQSDIHQQGRQAGYGDPKLYEKYYDTEEKYIDNYNKKLEEIKNDFDEGKLGKYMYDSETGHYLMRDNKIIKHSPYGSSTTGKDLFISQYLMELTNNHPEVKPLRESVLRYESQVGEGKVPDIPFKGDLWWQLPLKWAISEAVNKGYSGILLPTAKQISDASGGEEKGLRILYENKIPKWLKKYAKQWEADLKPIEIDEFNDISFGARLEQTISAFEQSGYRPQHVANSLYQARQSLKSGTTPDRVYHLMHPDAKSRFSTSSGRPTKNLMLEITPKMRDDLTKSGQSLFAKNLPGSIVKGAKNLANQLIGSQVELDPSVPNVDEFVRKAISQGKTVNLPESFVQQQFDILKPHLDMVIKGVSVRILASIKPFNKENVHAVFKDKDGKKHKELFRIDQLLDSRAFFQSGVNTIFFSHLQVPTGFENSLIGELWHENIHALRRLSAIPVSDWSRLLSHFGSSNLGILDLDYQSFAKAIGHPNWQQFNGKNTIRQIYSEHYSNDPHYTDYTDSEIEETLNEEAIAHGMEIYVSGYLGDEIFAPIRAIIDNIRNNVYKRGGGQESSVTQRALKGPYSGIKVELLPKLPANSIQYELGGTKLQKIKDVLGVLTHSELGQKYDVFSLKVGDEVVGFQIQSKDKIKVMYFDTNADGFYTMGAFEDFSNYKDFTPKEKETDGDNFDEILIHALPEDVTPSEYISDILDQETLLNKLISAMEAIFNKTVTPEILNKEYLVMPLKVGNEVIGFRVKRNNKVIFFDMGGHGYHTLSAFEEYADSSPKNSIPKDNYGDMKESVKNTLQQLKEKETEELPVKEEDELEKIIKELNFQINADKVEKVIASVLEDSHLKEKIENFYNYGNDKTLIDKYVEKDSNKSNEDKFAEALYKYAWDQEDLSGDDKYTIQDLALNIDTKAADYLDTKNWSDFNKNKKTALLHFIDENTKKEKSSDANQWKKQFNNLSRPYYIKKYNSGDLKLYFKDPGSALANVFFGFAEDNLKPNYRIYHQTANLLKGLPANAKPPREIPEGYAPAKYKDLNEARKNLTPLALELFDTLSKDKWIKKYSGPKDLTHTNNTILSNTIKNYIDKHGDAIPNSIKKQLLQVSDDIIPQPKQELTESAEPGAAVEPKALINEEQKPLSFGDLLKQQRAEDPTQRHYTFVGKASGGTKPKEVWVDQDGVEYMFKPVPAGSEFLAYSEAIGGQITKMINPDAPEIFTISLKNRLGTLQRYLPNKGTLRQLRIGVKDLSVKQIRQLQREHVIDWMISNHDSHDNQFLVDEDDNIIAIDKGQAFKHLGRDELSIDYHPNKKFGEKEPIYNTIWRAYKNNGLEQFRNKIEEEENVELSSVKKELDEVSKQSKKIQSTIDNGITEVSKNTNKLKEDFQNGIEESDWYQEAYTNLQQNLQEFAETLQFTPLKENQYYVNSSLLSSDNKVYAYSPLFKSMADFSASSNPYDKSRVIEFTPSNPAPLEKIIEVFSSYIDDESVKKDIQNAGLTKHILLHSYLYTGSNAAITELANEGYDSIIIGEGDNKFIIATSKAEVESSASYDINGFNNLKEKYISEDIPYFENAFYNSAIESLRDIFTKKEFDEEILPTLNKKAILGGITSIFDTLINIPHYLLNDAKSALIDKEIPGTLSQSKLNEYVEQVIPAILKRINSNLPNEAIAGYYKYVIPDSMSPTKLMQLSNEKVELKNKLSDLRDKLKIAEEKLDDALHTEILNTVEKIQALLSDDAYREMLQPYAENLFKGREGPIEAFLDYAVERKNNLSSKFYKFYSSLGNIRERAREGMSSLTKGQREVAGNIKKSLGNFTESLTDAEVTAIRNYTGSNFVEINGGLRENPTHLSGDKLKINRSWAKYSDYSTLIESGLNKLPPYEGVVYRRESDSNLPHIKKIKVGKIYSSPQFFSTTKTVLNPGEYEVLYKIKSVTGRYVRNLSQHPSEEEVLFAPNRLFLVTKVIVHPNPNIDSIDSGYYEIHMREFEQIDFSQAEESSLVEGDED